MHGRLYVSEHHVAFRAKLIWTYTVPPLPYSS